jgi:hypothetical protein
MVFKLLNSCSVESPNITNQQIETTDNQLRSSLQANGTRLAVMLGHRPTILAADVGTNNYFAHDKLTATNLHNGKVVLLLWTPDPSIANRVTWYTTTIDRILSLVPMIVNVIDRLLHSMGIDYQSSRNTGLTASHAHTITEWYKR